MTAQNETATEVQNGEMNEYVATVTTTAVIREPVHVRAEDDEAAEDEALRQATHTLRGCDPFVVEVEEA